MFEVKALPSTLTIKVVDTSAPNGYAIKDILVRALKERQEKCEAVSGVRGGPDDDQDQMRLDLPILNALLEKLV